MPNSSRNCQVLKVTHSDGIISMDRIELGRHEASGDKRESFLQDLVHLHPTLLPMQEIEPAFMPLVSVCMELPTEAGFLDNLWMTPSGGIVLGECKLVRNTQARREVVVQALDYARSMQGWHYDDLQNAVRRAQKQPDLSLWQMVSNAASDGDSLSEPDFTDAVERRLRDGRFVVLMILDGVQEGLEALTSYLQLHAGLHVSLAIVELSIWQGQGQDLIVVPRIPLRTVLVERGIVIIDSNGSARINPAAVSGSVKDKPNSILPKPYTNSQSEFYDRLELKVAGIKTTLQGFVDDLEAIGIVGEYGRSLILRWHPTGDVAASAGYVDAYGAVWLGDAYLSAVKLGHEQAGNEYLETLARTVGGTVQRYENGTSSPRVRGANGQTVSVSELLKHAPEWKAAIQRLLTAAMPS